MPLRSVWFWARLYPLLRGLSVRTGTPVNTLVNLAVQSFVGVVGEGELRVWSEVEKLVREDSQLRRVSSTMLRSGSYLPKYADRLFRAPWDAEGVSAREGFRYVKPRVGDVPLKALNPKEEAVMRRVLARREAIAQRIAELLDLVLPKEKFRLVPKRSGSRRRDKHNSVKNVRKDEEDGVKDAFA
ncbi:MAG: hypothetical protein OEW62_06865 [Candidatus Bathyarchaeota archaeon]|nr:hypothetical protein [Candidatus Bathyarchaeota archaeon]